MPVVRERDTASHVIGGFIAGGVALTVIWNHKKDKGASP